MEKRDSFNQRIGQSKKGQITIFIILGILLLFAFIMVYQITTALNKSKLDTEKQKVLNKLLQPAALNIYINDCLEDNLKDGLKLLGQQGGKFWSDQPGGYAEFFDTEGMNAEDPYQEQGLVRAAYGLAYSSSEPENEYPCTGNLPAPAFCSYVFPNLKYSFGSLIGVNVFDIETSLSNYLSNTTAECIEKALNEKMLTGKAEVKLNNAKVLVSLQSSGVQVEALYPMVLSYGKEKIETQQKFSFTLTGKYKQFFEGVSDLLYNDIHFLEFNLTDDYNKKEFTYTSNEDTGQCKLLESSGEKKTYSCKGFNYLTKWDIEVEPKGELFIFKSNDPELQIEGKTYFFQIYRQNRPPVLDYISQWPSETYDYLVIPEDEKLGTLDLTASARDPDEDKITYSFSGEDLNQFKLKDSTGNEIKTDVKTKDNVAVQTENFGEGQQSPIKTVTVKASDGDLADWQDVRILVEKEPKMNLKILSPYSDIAEGKVSLEDPVFIEVDYPETLSKEGKTKSILEIAGQQFTLEQPGCYYLDKNGPTTLDIPTCDSAAIKKQLSNIKSKGFTNIFTALGQEEASLHIRFEYSEEQKHDFAPESKIFSVKECLLHQQTSILDKEFFVSHSCCTENGGYAKTTVVCKKDKTGIEAEQSCNKDGILQGKFIPTYCSGKSSYCDGQPAKEISDSLEVCGKITVKDCKDKVIEKCQEKKPGSYLSDKSGACLDCQTFCDKTKDAVVYTGKPESLPFTLQKVSLNKDFVCGCSGQTGQPCDSNFDGFFKGTCKDNKCSEESS